METNTNPDSDSTSPEVQNESAPASPAPEPAPTSPEVSEALPAVADAVPEPQAEAIAAAEQMEFPAEGEPAPEPVAETPAQEPTAPEEAPAEQPTEAPSEEAPPQQAPTGEEEGDPLQALAQRSQAQRLSAPDEERAAALLKEALLQGRAGVARAVQALGLLPWVIGVNAVTGVWPELKPFSRNQLFAGLAKQETDNAKRMRLSLARGLFKVDPPFALKIATAVAKELREKETGAVSGKNAHIFANVLIGRAKPWIAQLPLADLKPADADALVHCALLAAFSLPHAPITQLGVLKWATDAGKTGKLHPLVLEAATKSVSRWSGKWQAALRKEVQELPEELVAVLKEPKAEPAKKNGEIGEPSEAAEPAEVEADSESAEAAKHPAPAGEEPDAEAATAAVRQEPSEGPAETPQAKPRPVYESKTVPRKPQQPQQQQQQQPSEKPAQPAREEKPRLRETPIPELLRAVESQFQSLRGDLQKAESKLRQKEEEIRRLQKKQTERASVPVIEGEPTPEELARLNRQLENRNQELQSRIEELTADAEARAVSVGAVTDQPVDDPNTQLRTLLVLKLQEDYEDFLALEKESPDIVVQQHYRTVLRHVFEVLTTEGVQFQQQSR